MLCQYVVAPLCTENSLSVIPGGKPSRLLAPGPTAFLHTVRKFLKGGSMKDKPDYGKINSDKDSEEEFYEDSGKDFNPE